MRKKRLSCLLVVLIVLIATLAPPAYAAGSLEVSSSVTPQGLDSAGNVTIDLTLANTGELALEDVRLVAENGSESPLGDIAPGETRSFQVSNFFVAQEQIGGTVPLTFMWFEEGQVQTLEHGVPIAAKQFKPELKITRSAEPSSGKKGETIELKYVVENTGDIRINDIKIEDPIVGEAIAEGVDLRPGRSQTYRSEITLENSVESRPTASGVAEDGTPAEAVTPSLTIDMKNPSLSIVVTQGAPADLPAPDGSGVSAGVGTSFDIHVTNDGNLPLSAITLQDDLGAIVEDGLKLAPGEDVHYAYVQSTLEEREIVITASCVAEGEESRLEFKSAGVALAPSYRPEDISITANASVDKTMLQAPGEIQATIHIVNDSPVPIFTVEVSESGAGVIQTIDRIEAGKAQDVVAKMQIVQSGQLTFTIKYADMDKRPYSLSIAPIDIGMAEATPAPTAAPPSATPAPAPTTRSNAYAILILMAILVLLLIVALITLIVVLVRHTRLKRRSEEDGTLVADARPSRPTPAPPEKPETMKRSRGERVEAPQPVEAKAPPLRSKPASQHVASPFQNQAGERDAKPVQKPAQEGAPDSTRRAPVPTSAAPPPSRKDGLPRQTAKTPTPQPKTQAQAPRNAAPDACPPRPAETGGAGLAGSGDSANRKPQRKPIQKDITKAATQDAPPTAGSAGTTAAKPTPPPMPAPPKPPEPAQALPLDDEDYFVNAFLGDDE